MLPVGQRNSCFCPTYFFCFSRLRPLTYQMCLNLKKNFIFLSHPPGPPSPRAAAPRPGCPRGRAAWSSSRARGGWTAATGSCAPTESEKGRRKETILALEMWGQMISRLVWKRWFSTFIKSLQSNMNWSPASKSINSICGMNISGQHGKWQDHHKHRFDHHQTFNTFRLWLCLWHSAVSFNYRASPPTWHVCFIGRLGMEFKVR